MPVGKAADQGYALAQALLGAMYETGSGVPQDYAQAASWFRKVVAAKMTPQQIAEAQKLASDWAAAHPKP